MRGRERARKRARETGPLTPAAPAPSSPCPLPSRTLSRSREKSLEIQAYAKSKYASEVVVDELLKFSIEIMDKVAAGGRADRATAAAV